MWMELLLGQLGGSLVGYFPLSMVGMQQVLYFNEKEKLRTI